MLPGLGISAKWHGKTLVAGNKRLLEENSVKLPGEVLEKAERYVSQGSTIVYVGISGTPAGFLVLTDTLRAESEKMIRAIKDTGVRPLLLTGDNENAAYAIAGRLGIDDCHAACLPEDKLNWIDSYQGRNEPVCMIGDGVNDAPALKKALVGIAMGGVGSDIAVDAADIALVHNAGSVFVIINSALLLRWGTKE